MAFIFIWLYELFIGPNFSDPTYREGIFLFVGLCMFTFPIALSALYYVVLNGNSSFAKLRYSKHWFMFMFLSILIVVGATLLISKAQTGSSQVLCSAATNQVDSGICSPRPASRSRTAGRLAIAAKTRAFGPP